MFMSMGWDYISDLRSTTGLLYIPQAIHEHREPWWNDIDRGKLIRPSELPGNLSSRVISSKQEKRTKESWIWPCEVLLFIFSKWFFTFLVLLQHWASGFTSKKEVMRIFIAIKNPFLRPGLNSLTFGLMADELTAKAARWVVSFTLRPLYPRRINVPDIHKTGCWVSDRTSLDAIGDRKFSCYCRQRNPGRPVRSFAIMMAELHNSIRCICIMKDLPKRCSSLTACNYLRT
jgi:hypothetical protein